MKHAARWRLALVLVLLGACFLPWTTAPTAIGVSVQRGFDRAGAILVPALLALWGIAATALLARGTVALRAGSALTDGGVLLGGAALLLFGHAWVPDATPRHAAALVGLALLALLHACVLALRGKSDPTVSWARVAAGLLTGIVLLLGGAPYAGALALWAGLSATLSATFPAGRAAALRLLLAACAVLLAPWLADLLREEAGTAGVYLGRYLAFVAASLLVILALPGLRTSPRESSREAR